MGAIGQKCNAPFVDVDTIDVFVSSVDAGARIREMRTGQRVGPSIRVSNPYDFGVFMYARSEGNVPVVSDVQTYLDLYSRGGRDVKQAQYLLENRIQTNWKAA